LYLSFESEEEYGNLKLLGCDFMYFAKKLPMSRRICPGKKETPAKYIYLAAWRHTPEDWNLNQNHCGALRIL